MAAGILLKLYIDSVGAQERTPGMKLEKKNHLKKMGVRTQLA